MDNFHAMIPGVRLAQGSHKDAGAEMCAMEMVAWLEGLPHSDSPPCTCPVLASYVRVINDRMPSGERDRLLPFLPRLVGTVSPEHKRARAEHFALSAVRRFAPPALRLVGLEAEALACEQATDLKSAERAARAASKAARAAAAAAAAYAADAAAAYAAYADAAYAAAYAAYADAAYADAAKLAGRFRGVRGEGGESDPWAVALDVLDQALAIGPQAPGFSRPVPVEAAVKLGMIDA